MSEPGAASAAGSVTWALIAGPAKLSRIALAAWVVGSVVEGVAMATERFELIAAGALIAFVASPAFIISYVRSLTQASLPGSVTVRGDSVTIQAGAKVREVSRAQVVSALVIPQAAAPSHPLLELRMADGDVVRLQSGEPQAAQRLAVALGFGPGGRSIEVDLAKPVRRLLHLLIAVFLTFPVRTMLGVMVAMGVTEGGYGVGQAATPLLVAGLYLLARRAIASPVLRIGEDGVGIRRGFRRRFIPRAAIASVERFGLTGLAFRSPRGDMRFESQVFGGDPARVEAVAQHLTSLLRTENVSSARVAAFDKGDETVAAWRARVAGVLECGGYRDASSPVEEANAILRSGLASPVERVGAALALRAAGEPATRIRVAAEAVADDALRAALEAAAEGDDSAVEKAVARLPR